MKKPKISYGNCVFFKLVNGDVLFIEKHDYDEENMTPNCVTISCISKKDFENNWKGEKTNKMPSYYEDEPFIISNEVKFK